MAKGGSFSWIMKMYCVMYNSVNILCNVHLCEHTKAIKLYTLNRQMACYVNFSSIKLFYKVKENKCPSQGT